MLFGFTIANLVTSLFDLNVDSTSDSESDFNISSLLDPASVAIAHLIFPPVYVLLDITCTFHPGRIPGWWIEFLHVFGALSLKLSFVFILGTLLAFSGAALDQQDTICSSGCCFGYKRPALIEW